MYIDLGCSRYKTADYIGIDILRVEGADVIGDACYLPFADSSVDGIYANHCIEHIQDQLSVIGEMWRVCRDGAIIHLIVPHFSNPAYYDDLTHQHLYSTRSFEHYDHDYHDLTGHPNYLPDVNLKAVFKKLNYWQDRTIVQKNAWKRSLIKTARWMINYFGNWNHFLCERFWCRWTGGFYEVEYKLKVIKNKKIHTGDLK